MKAKCIIRNAALLLLGMMIAVGCGTGRKSTKSNDFFTSGSRDADQRASQRMAKAEQLAGSGEGAGEKEKVKKEAAGASSDTGDKDKTVKATNKAALFDRLGGQDGITKIVDDFLSRAMVDPRVNWDRSGVKGGNFIHHTSVAWSPTPDNVAQLKKHMIEFFALATGGPAQYTGREIQSAHSNMKISNPEFDAAVGDLKASLDKLQVPNQEQKELLSIVESTRPQIVTQR